MIKLYLVWDLSFEGAMYSPLVVVVDLDSDGNQEAVLSTWHGVIAYDLLTGQEKYECMYRQIHARQYGFLGAYTDLSGRVYLIVVGDFAGHIGALSVRDGELRNLWYHRFDPQSEQGIDRRFTINTIDPDPMGDFDSDGHGELLMNVFNENGDARWHLIAYDLETGERWHHDFAGFNGRAPVWNECGTTIWAAGHFADPERVDIMVSNRRSIMHSDETLVLDSHQMTSTGTGSKNSCVPMAVAYWPLPNISLTLSH